MLFNEPKLLKSPPTSLKRAPRARFSALQRAEIAEMTSAGEIIVHLSIVSVLFNEPKLLKSFQWRLMNSPNSGFSALQRAEIAEISRVSSISAPRSRCFSALQRAEIAEIRR